MNKESLFYFFRLLFGFFFIFINKKSLNLSRLDIFPIHNVPINNSMNHFLKIPIPDTVIITSSIQILSICKYDLVNSIRMACEYF